MIKLRPIHLAIAGIWIGAAVLGLAVMRQPHPPRPTVTWTPSAATPTPSQALRKISAEELSASDGKNGHPCYVAVDRLVYVIPSNLIDWKNGQHVPSNGLVYCGRDVSAEISKAPHGTGVLSSLEIAGTL